ncbi:hypothetical protein PMAYCL1PPCAC_03579, partial [Pristionchus mayeri]
SKPVARVVDEAPKKKKTTPSKRHTIAAPSKTGATPASCKSRATTAAAAAKKDAKESAMNEQSKKGKSPARRVPHAKKRAEQEQEGKAAASGPVRVLPKPAPTAPPLTRDDSGLYSVKLDLGTIRALCAAHMVQPDRKVLV